jgi:hypothetical protein
MLQCQNQPIALLSVLDLQFARSMYHFAVTHDKPSHEILLDNNCT